MWQSPPHPPPSANITIDASLKTEPSIICTTMFDFIKSDADQLASDLCCAAGLLLDSLDALQSSNPELGMAYRIQLDPIRIATVSREGLTSHDLAWKTWRLKLRIDPTLWFEHVLMPMDTDVRKALHIARGWARVVHKEAIGVPTALRRLPSQVSSLPDTFKDDCENGEDCVHQRDGRCRSKRHEPKHKCGGATAGVDGSESQCGWMMQSQLLISELQDWYHQSYCNCTGSYKANEFNLNNSIPYRFYGRREGTRDILLCPSRHITNRDLSRDHTFWNCVVRSCRRMGKQLQTQTFPVSGVAINFGTWETAQSRNRYAADCHAHAHLFLLPSTIIKCTDNLYKGIKARSLDPDNWELKDCVALETMAIFSWDNNENQKMLQSIEAKVRRLDGIEKEISDIKSTLRELLVLIKNKRPAEDETQSPRKKPRSSSSASSTK